MSWGENPAVQLTLRIFVLSVACFLCANAFAGSSPESDSSLPRPHDEGAPHGQGERLLNLTTGKSVMLEVKSDIADVILADPNVADVVVRSRRHVYLIGMQPGETNAILVGTEGQELLCVKVRVTRDLEALRQAFRDLLPSSRISVRMLADSLVLTGEATTPADAAHAAALAKRFAGKPEQVVNLLSVSGKEQVLLSVTVAEINRTHLRRLGVQLPEVAAVAGRFSGRMAISGLFGVTSGAVPSAGSLPAPSGATLGGTLTSGNWTGKAMLEALEREGHFRVLAEPNLTAISGETANFLAGGEFPIPVARGEGDQLSIEWKPFGVGLAFTPVVLSEGRISLKIATEVSELTAEGSVQSAGIAVPAIKLRRVTSSVELPSGGAVMLAGLISEETRRSADRVPDLHNLPVLGPLFGSRDFTRSETELVVIVAAYLVDGRPRDRFSPPSRLAGAPDWAAVLEPAEVHGSLSGAAGPLNGRR